MEVLERIEDKTADAHRKEVQNRDAAGQIFQFQNRDVSLDTHV